MATVPPSGGAAKETPVSGPSTEPKIEIAMPGTTVPAAPLAALITPAIVGVTFPTCRVTRIMVGTAEPAWVMLIVPL